MPHQQPVTIVMVEDDSGHAKLIEKNIRRAGVCNEIRHFSDGTTALEHLFATGDKDGGPFLVLLDLNLPDMSGTDILARLKADESRRLTPVVVLTTTDDPREVERCHAIGCNSYMVKPVDYDKFAEAIGSLGHFVTLVEVPEINPKT